MGFTISEIDKLLIPYVEKSYLKYKEEYKSIVLDNIDKMDIEVLQNKMHDYAIKKIRKDMEQGFQGLEYKLNTVASSRGDYPFTTFTFGLSTNIFGSMVSEVALEVRKNGQGKEGKKKSVLFPKLVFLYTEDLHGEGKELEWLFNKAIECSSKAMYPDYLSLDGDTTLAKMYHKYGEVISPMGCRAFLSPYYEKGGMKPLDESDKPFFIGRFNCGVVSLNLPMIYMKARQENKDFYDVLDYYLELARTVHKWTYEYLAEMKASTNPLGFCQGGFHDGFLNPNDKIRPLLKYATFSFGITALNELNRLYNKKSIREDGEFPLEVMRYINKKIKEFKEEDNILFALYGRQICRIKTTKPAKGCNTFMYC